MVENTTSTIDHEERREFLKALGVTGAAAAGSVTFDEVQEAVSTPTTTDLAPIGQAIQSDLAGSLDTTLLTSQQTALATAASELPTVVDRGFPDESPRDEFHAVAAAGQPVYDHLLDVGFFESTTSHLPAFDAEHIKDSVQTAINTDAFAAALTDLGLSDTELVDLVATVGTHRERIGERHWVQTDELPRQDMEIGEFVAPMTQNAAGGVLLWLADLDEHLWSHQVILTEDILADAVWEARAMAAGFTLMTEGANAIGSNDAALSDAEFTSVLSSGFALQAIAQNLLPEDVYWVTEEMRAPARTDLEPADTQY